MRLHTLILALALPAVVLAGCANETLSEDRDEIRRLTQSRADLGRDLCELLDFYGDGEYCDDFCPRPDPDCGQACMTREDCSQIYCVTAPCPVNDCIAGTCQIRGRGDDCPDLSTVRCGYGIETDEFGCEVCADPPECAPVLCELFCPYGFATAEDGCAICRCADPPGGEACMADTDCPQPLCLPGGPCPSNVCVDGMCVSEDRPECVADTDCPQPSCLPGGPCPEIGCVDGACVDVSDRQCRRDEDCPQPMCLPGGPCFTNVCDAAGMCVRDDAGGPCSSSADCGPTEMCSGDCTGPGTCVPRPTDVFCATVATPYCDCDGNQRYSSNACIYDRYAHTGMCMAPPDCRSMGCDSGRSCQFCWGNWACIPDGALC